MPSVVEISDLLAFNILLLQLLRLRQALELHAHWGLFGRQTEQGVTRKVSKQPCLSVVGRRPTATALLIVALNPMVQDEL